MQWVLAFANYQEDNNTLFMLNWIVIFVYLIPQYYKLKRKKIYLII